MVFFAVCEEANSGIPLVPSVFNALSLKSHFSVAVFTYALFAGWPAPVVNRVPTQVKINVV